MQTEVAPSQSPTITAFESIALNESSPATMVIAPPRAMSLAVEAVAAPRASGLAKNELPSSAPIAGGGLATAAGGAAAVPEAPSQERSAKEARTASTASLSKPR